MRGISGHTEESLSVCRIVTVPITLSTLLREQVMVIADSNISIELVSSPGKELDFINQEYGLPCHAVPMSRSISPVQDAHSLLRLFRLFRSKRFRIAHSSTPKAGLLTAIAGWLAGVPVRLHTFTGQPWVELHGWRRNLMRFSDKLIAKLNTFCYADSVSQQRFLIDEGIVPATRISVLASGSISGVDLERFNPEKWRGDQARATRRELHIAEDALVIVFVGRITLDKGIVELVSAFDQLGFPEEQKHLVLVGPFDSSRETLPTPILCRIADHPQIHTIDFTRQPEKYMAIADVFCLPSYREGFGSVVIEAAALGIPAVVTSIVGLIDTVVPGVTGLLVSPKDEQSLCVALSMLFGDAELRARLGQSARMRVQKEFDSATVNQAVVDEYWNVYRRYLGRNRNDKQVVVKTLRS